MNSKLNRLKRYGRFHNPDYKINSAAWLFVFICFLLSSASVFADEVTSKGTVLRGKVLSFSSAGVEFETEYGAGAIAIPWENVEAIKTEGPFRVLYGGDREIDAPIQGITEGRLTVFAARLLSACRFSKRSASLHL